jgi:predicted RNA-binding protein with PUA-like domain
VARVSGAARPDPTAWDPESEYFDPRSPPEKPLWVMVTVELVERFAALVTLAELKGAPALAGMLVTRRGQRLSIQPVAPAHFRAVVAMGRRKAARTS